VLASWPPSAKLWAAITTHSQSNKRILHGESTLTDSRVGNDNVIACHFVDYDGASFPNNGRQALLSKFVEAGFTGRVVNPILSAAAARPRSDTMRSTVAMSAGD